MNRRRTKYKTKPKHLKAQQRRVRALCWGRKYRCIQSVSACYNWAHDPDYRLSELAMAVATFEDEHAKAEAEGKPCECEKPETFSKPWRDLLVMGVGL